MDRRQFVGASFGGTALAMFAASAGVATAAAVATASPRSAAKGDSSGSDLPRRRRVNVAFMLGERANVIDTAGPWEVFQDTRVGTRYPFRLYTVAPTKAPLTMTGGLRVLPDYSIEDAPQPDVIVVPAQQSTPASRAWLKRASAGTDVTMSVCTGAFQLASVGLLDGFPATTHHLFWDKFEKEFPDIELRRGLRFVDSGRIATAGGLTSGIDMALHVVMRYFGAEVAAATARYMEFDSQAWRGEGR